MKWQILIASLVLTTVGAAGIFVETDALGARDSKAATNHLKTIKVVGETQLPNLEGLTESTAAKSSLGDELAAKKKSKSSKSSKKGKKKKNGQSKKSSKGKATPSKTKKGKKKS